MNNIVLSDQLLRIINYSDCIQLGTFNSVVGEFLSRAILSRAILSRAILSGADLSRAYLSGADLSRAYLSNEEFGDIRWDEGTKWESVHGLETAVNVPEALKQQLGLE